jgi:hypothetical protein
MSVATAERRASERREATSDLPLPQRQRRGRAPEGGDRQAARPGVTQRMVLLAQLTLFAGSGTVVSPWPLTTFAVLLTVWVFLMLFGAWLTNWRAPSQDASSDVPLQLPPTIAIYDSAVVIVVQAPSEATEAESAAGDSDASARRDFSAQRVSASKKAKSRS